MKNRILLVMLLAMLIALSSCHHGFIKPHSRKWKKMVAQHSTERCGQSYSKKTRRPRR